MKAKVSKELQAIIRDPQARRKLMETLVLNQFPSDDAKIEPVTILVKAADNKTVKYQVSAGPATDLVALSSEKKGSRETEHSKRR